MYSSTLNPGAKYVSFGYRCTSAGLLRRLGLREESHPFDWMISRLPVVKDCIANKFSQFRGEFAQKETSTVSYDPESGERDLLVCDEKVWFNTHYSTPDPCHTNKRWKEGNDTYAYSMAFNHHDITLPDTQQYFTRCIDRFYSVLLSRNDMRFLYVHPIHDEDEHAEHCNTLLSQFAEFHGFIQSQRSHPARGIFVLPVRTNIEYPITSKYADPVETVVSEEGRYIVLRVMCNKDIVDAGEIWYRNGYIEEDRLLRKISEYFNK